MQTIWKWSLGAAFFGGVVLSTVAASADDSGASLVTELVESGTAAAYFRLLDISTSDAKTPNMYIRKPRSSMRYLGNNAYADDRAGTVSTEVWHLDSLGERRITDITVGPSGELMFSSSRWDDGDLIASLVILDRDGLLRQFPTEVGDPLEPCIEQAVNAPDAVTALADCFGFSKDDSESGTPLLSDLNNFWNPDCDKHGMVSIYVPPTWHYSARTVRNIARQAINRRGWAVAGQDWQLADALEKVIRAAGAVMTYDPMVPSGRGPTDPTTDAEKALQQAVEELETLLESRGEDTTIGGASSEPSIGEGGVGSNVPDSRCAERDTDSQRGTLFSNPDFCKSGDYLQCLAEEQDPVQRITNGKCRTVEGPAGGTMLACGDNPEWSGLDWMERAKSEASSNCGSSPDGMQSYCDFNVPFANTNDIGKEYIETLDLGPVLGGLCAAGGCPLDLR